ncbi:MAG: hypothetical protein AB7V16_12920 [Vulcanibacillus sp.]
MKQLIIIVGTIILGFIVINSLILGDNEDSMKSQGESIMNYTDNYVDSNFPTTPTTP